MFAPTRNVTSTSMGFPSLLKEVQDQGTTVDINFLARKNICVDGYNFLFNITRPWAYEIMVQKQTTRLFGLFKRILDPLMSVCNTVYLIWDGRQLPCKAITSGDRILKREHMLEQGMRLLEVDMEEAVKHIKKGFYLPTDIIATLNEQLCQRYQGNRTRFCAFTAPYEADQQMALMARQGLVDVILSNDSDMLMYSVDVVREWCQRGEQSGIHYDKNVFMGVLKREGVTFEQYLFNRITMTCDYFPYAVWLERRSPSEYRPGNEACGRYGSEGRLVQTLVCCLYQFFYQLVFDFVQNKIVPLNYMPPEEQRLLQYLPTNVVGTAKGVEIVPNNNAAQTSLLLRQISAAKQMRIRGPFRYSIFSGFQIKAAGSQVGLFGLQGDIDCNSIYEDYLEKAPQTLAQKFTWQPKQHNVRIVVVKPTTPQDDVYDDNCISRADTE